MGECSTLAFLHALYAIKIVLLSHLVIRARDWNRFCQFLIFSSHSFYESLQLTPVNIMKYYIEDVEKDSNELSKFAISTISGKSRRVTSLILPTGHYLCVPPRVSESSPQ